MGLAAFITLFFLVPEGATPWVLVANLATFYALFLRAITDPDRLLPRLPSYLTVEVLFFAYSYLIFYYPYQLFVLGATDLRVSRFVSNPFVDGSNKAITLTTIGMLAFTIGHRILGRADRLVADDADMMGPDGDDASRRSPFRPLAIVSSALLLILVAIYLLAGWRSAGEGRYTGTTTTALGIEGTSTAVLVLCMMVAALWVYARANALDTPPILAIGLLVTVGWAVRLLILGDRNSFLLVALVLVGGYFTFVRRASLIVIAGSFGVWMFLYYAIEVLRTIPNWYRTGNFMQALEYSQYQQGSSGENSFNVTTITLRATVEVVPSGHDFMYGVLKVIQASSAIPFSGRLYLPYLKPEYSNSAEMLTEILLGRRATWGTGTNVISDSYLDFGVLGVVAIMFALGLSAKAIRNYVARDPYDPHRVVMYLLALALFAELPRYAIEVPIRFLAWAFILSMIVKATAGRLHKRRGPGISGARPKTSTTTEEFVARNEQDRRRTPFVVQSATHEALANE